MWSGESLTFFLASTLALNITPGPDMLYVIARSMGEGRKSGVISSLGIAAGCILHTLLVAIGLSKLLIEVPLVFEAIKYVGAGYLLYLGFRALTKRQDAIRALSTEPARSVNVFSQGMMTNLFNPKVALFFLAFLPQFVNERAGHVMVQLVVLGTLFNISGTLVNVGVAFLASRLGAWFQGGTGAAALLLRLPGVVFVALGLRLAFGRRPG